MQLADPIQEGARILTICNACRYCEGYCAVFPAMERRLNFPEADLNYLANLCHQCAECFYACQYAPPHEFAVNVPKTLAEIRAQSYQKYAWPRPLGSAFPHTARWAGYILAICLIVSVVAMAMLPGMDIASGDFYGVVPHGVMAGLYSAVSVFVVLALLIGVGRCWREWKKGLAELATPAALGSATKDVLRLRYLDNTGAGCTYPREQDSQSRRWFHHFTFYGFLLCFAATSVAAVYHYLFGWRAPYGYFSLPVILGTAGGIGLLIGPAGLYWLKQHRDPSIADAKQDGMDVSFLTLLFLTSITGVLLLALRQTLAMGPLLVIHLGIVLALFLTLPYGKFVHGFYRSAALVRYALERLAGEPPKPPSS